MNIEDRLREHLGHAAEALPPPPDHLDRVTRRGRRRRLVQRGTAVVAAAALLVAVPLVLRGFDRTTVEFDPAEPGPEPPVTDTDEGHEAAGLLTPAELGAPVLAWGPYEHDQLLRVDSAGEEVVAGPVDTAFPDGRGGMVFKPAGLDEVRWSGHARPVAEADDALSLRGLLPDGRIVYSVRSDRTGENEAERFFTLTLAEDAQPEHLVLTGVFERTILGPIVAADGRLVYSSCHIHCALWEDVLDPPFGAEPLYEGLTIDGLTATPDGRVVAFVEYDLVLQDAPELVLLDGTSFEELARVGLPGETEQRMGVPVVSLSPGAQQVLVSLGASGEPGVPTTPYLVDGALTGEPSVQPIDFTGALRWADPVAEVSVAERLIAFARDPGPDTFGDVPFADEVILGLGPELFGQETVQAAALADPAAWALDDEGDFRAYVGPFSALDLLMSADHLRVEEGSQPRCASPPMPAADELAGLRRLSIQPVEIDGCLSWFSIDLFVNEGGEVAAVTLDLYEP